MLDGETMEQTKTSAEIIEPEKKPTGKHSAAKKQTAKTTNKPAPKKSGGRKKKSDTSIVKDVPQASTL